MIYAVPLDALVQFLKDENINPRVIQPLIERVFNPWLPDVTHLAMDFLPYHTELEHFYQSRFSATTTILDELDGWIRSVIEYVTDRIIDSLDIFYWDQDHSTLYLKDNYDTTNPIYPEPLYRY